MKSINKKPLENELYRIIEEYTITLHKQVGIGNKKFMHVKGRIKERQTTKSDEYKFQFEVSHFCRQHALDADVYIPGKHASDLTYEDAKRYLFKYMQDFAGFTIKANPNY